LSFSFWIAKKPNVKSWEVKNYKIYYDKYIETRKHLKNIYQKKGKKMEKRLKGALPFTVILVNMAAQ